ncbi:MAG: biopolymer transporter ExbD [Gammaproteobacteria bacterium]|nr:MAG: biopolymer transporter ExbD [Gammaproteobacteria bacterium]
MKRSARAQRIARRNARHSGRATLNLVSLMDIFTILVFFLMVNSSDIEVIQTSSALRLPDSVVEQKPREVLMVTVTRDAILVAGQPVAPTPLDADAPEFIEGLRKELAYRLSRIPDSDSEQPQPLNILADRTLPYSVLKRVMKTSVDAGYTILSLAVNQTSLKPEGSDD